MKNYQLESDNLLKSMNVVFSAEWVKFDIHFEGDKQKRNIYKCSFRRGGRSFSLMFGQSIAAGKKTPTSYDVVSCLQKHDVGSFSDFCGEFGYDTDSRSAKKIYKAVCKEFAKVNDFFSDSEIEKLAEIQ